MEFSRAVSPFSFKDFSLWNRLEATRADPISTDSCLDCLFRAEHQDGPEHDRKADQGTAPVRRMLTWMVETEGYFLDGKWYASCTTCRLILTTFFTVTGEGFTGIKHWSTLLVNLNQHFALASVRLLQSARLGVLAPLLTVVSIGAFAFF